MEEGGGRASSSRRRSHIWDGSGEERRVVRLFIRRVEVEGIWNCHGESWSLIEEVVIVGS